jgi:hypothetical protein
MWLISTSEIKLLLRCDVLWYESPCTKAGIRLIFCYLAPPYFVSRSLASSSILLDFTLAQATAYARDKGIQNRLRNSCKFVS